MPLEKKRATVSLVCLNNPNMSNEQVTAIVQESNLFHVLTAPIITKKEGWTQQGKGECVPRHRIRVGLVKVSDNFPK